MTGFGPDDGFAISWNLERTSKFFGK